MLRIVEIDNSCRRCYFYILKDKNDPCSDGYCWKHDYTEGMDFFNSFTGTCKSFIREAL